MPLPTPMDDTVATALQQGFAAQHQILGQQASRQNGIEQFVSGQVPIRFMQASGIVDAVASRTITGANDPLNNAILASRAAAGQPSNAPNANS